MDRGSMDLSQAAECFAPRRRRSGTETKEHSGKTPNHENENYAVVFFFLEITTVAHGNVRLSSGNCFEHRKAPTTTTFLSVL